MEVDTASAKAVGMTPALLAQKWADAIRNVLADQASVSSYVAHLTGDYEANTPNTVPKPNNAVAVTPAVTNPPTVNYQRGRVVYAPAGLTIPITLQTSISTQAAKAGDLVQAVVPKAILLGESQIPAGTTVLGIVADTSEGKLLGKAASLTVKFNQLRLPDGSEQPITAHLVGNIGKYATVGAEDTLKGETWKTKAGQAAIRGAIGAGTGAALGTAVGAVAGGKRGTGRGAWSGAAIGSGVGVAQSLLLRKGKEVTLQSGTALQLQLDAPLSLAGAPDKYTY
jgi:ribosomal protein L14